MCGCFGIHCVENAKGHFYLLPRAEQLSSQNECLWVVLARVTAAVAQVQCREGWLIDFLTHWKESHGRAPSRLLHVGMQWLPWGQDHPRHPPTCWCGTSLSPAASWGALLGFYNVFIKSCIKECLVYKQMHRIFASYFISSGSTLKNVFGHAEFGQKIALAFPQ